MTRIEGKPEKKYPWYVRAIFRLQRRKYGTILIPSTLWGRSPKVFLGLSSLYGALDRKTSPLEPQLRSLISVLVSSIIHCSFCMDINSDNFLKRKGDRHELEELNQFRTSPLFSEKEKAALEYAEAVTQTPNRTTDKIFNRLKEHFSDDEIIELTALIAFQNCSARFNSALEVPSQGFL